MANVGVEIVSLLPPPWPDGVHVSVFNGNEPATSDDGDPITEDVLRFDGKDWRFPRGEFETIPPEAASFLFGIETRIPEKLGQAMVLHPQQRQEAMIRYGAVNKAGKTWFNKFQFKLVKLGKRGGKDSWGKIMPIAELSA